MLPRAGGLMPDGGFSSAVASTAAAAAAAAAVALTRGGGARGASSSRTRLAAALALGGRGAKGRLRPVVASPSRSMATTGPEPAEAASATPGGGSALPPFHLAIPVSDLAAARDFYGAKLGCAEGRSASTWVDYNLYGHQLVCHEVRGHDGRTAASAVDGDPVPVPHFGLALSLPDFRALAARVEAAGIKCELGPRLRFRGQPGEQWTMFFRDPSGNALEFKSMSKPENLFARYVVKE